MTAEFTTRRRNMVDGQLLTTNVIDHRVLQAFLEVPRELFVPASRKDAAYTDADVDIGLGRYLMAPSSQAKLIQLAGIVEGDVVLDAGCATGYSSAILSRLAGSVIALEADESLAETASANLSECGCDNVVVLSREPAEGCSSEAPFDAILVNGSVDAVPQALLDQLKDGGRLVAVEGHGSSGRAAVHVRDGDTFSSRLEFNCAVKPLSGFQRSPEFEL